MRGLSSCKLHDATINLGHDIQLKGTHPSQMFSPFSAKNRFFSCIVAPESPFPTYDEIGSQVINQFEKMTKMKNGVKTVSLSDFLEFDLEICPKYLTLSKILTGIEIMLNTVKFH